METARSDNVQIDLFVAAATGSMEEVHQLVSDGADLDTPDEHGNTATHIAALHRHLSVVEALHDLGADMNALNDKGWTPVYTVASGHDDQTRFLKAMADLGADVNITSCGGWSPLHIACQQCRSGSVKSLIEAGADVDMAINSSGALTPMHLSASLGYWDICALLVNAGADITTLIAVPFAIPTSVSGILAPFQIDLLTTQNDPNSVAKRQVFSTVKVMSSVSRNRSSGVNIAVAGAGSDASCAVQGAAYVLEIELALVAAFHTLNPGYNSTLWSSRSTGAIHRTNYTMRRWLSKCAWWVHCQSPLGRRANCSHYASGGPQLTAVARQYAQLVFLFADQAVLTDLLALRLTCQSNNYRQRFPVTCLRSYHELEVNLVESFIATDASRLVPTGLLNSLLTLFPVKV